MLRALRRVWQPPCRQWLNRFFFFSLFPAGGRFSSVDSLFCKYFCPVLPAPVCSHVFLPELMGGLRLAPPLAWAPASSPAGTRTAGMWPPVPAELCVPGSGRHLEIIPARGLAWPDALLPGLDHTGFSWVRDCLRVVLAWGDAQCAWNRSARRGCLGENRLQRCRACFWS